MLHHYTQSKVPFLLVPTQINLWLATTRLVFHYNRLPDHVGDRRHSNADKRWPVGGMQFDDVTF